MPGRKGKGKEKGEPKGGVTIQSVDKGGKSQGKTGSQNKPKEPVLPGKPETKAPLAKTAWAATHAKAVEPAVITKTNPQGPPAKAGDSAPPAVPKETAAPKPVAITAALPVEPAAEEKAKPPLKLASKTGLDFSTPSKPEKPPAQFQGHEMAQVNDDEDKDLQAAVHASLQAPSSPQPQSGAQSSESKPTTDLDQQESELLGQLDRLMAESVRLESLPNPSVIDRSRIRSIATVAKDIEMKVNEIDVQRENQAASKARKIQERSVAAVKVSATSKPPKHGDTTEVVTSVVPPSTQPLTLDKLMAGIGQPEKAMVPMAPSPKTHTPPMEQGDQPKAKPQPAPGGDRPEVKSQAQVALEVQAPSLSAVPLPPFLMGRASERSNPPPEDRPKQRPSKEPAELSKERERTPPKEPSREARHEPSHGRERTPDSSKVKSKESRAEKHKKKESRRRRRSESDQPEKTHSGRDERSRSSRRPDPPQEAQQQLSQIEVSATDDPTPKSGSQLAIKDKPARARPRFDPTVEHVVGRRIAEKPARNRLAQQPASRQVRDSSTRGYLNL